MICVVDFVVLLWKNGGGVMCEIGVFLFGVVFDVFVWCVSVVDVGMVGLFLCFDGIDCMFVLLFGVGMMFVEVGGLWYVFDVLLVCVDFVGEMVIDVMLYDGVMCDFNLMMCCLVVCGMFDVWCVGVYCFVLVDIVLLFCVVGVVGVDFDGMYYVLEDMDMLWFDGLWCVFDVVVSGGGVLFVVLFVVGE